MRDEAPREFVELGPEVAARMPLATEPAAATVGAYVLTRGAGRAWEAINSHLASARGALFWIGGPAGAGKTHFLNYVMALSARAGALSAETARYLTHSLEVGGGLSAVEIQRRILDLIGAVLAGEDRTPALWRQMEGVEAWTIALDTARRQGVKGITLAIDFGVNKSAPVNGMLATLAQCARASRNLCLIVVAAGRGEVPEAALGFEVTAQAGEVVPVAVGRARRLDDSALRTVDGLYRDLDDGVWDTHAIYPLHPAAASTLQSLRAPEEGVATLATAVREAIEPWHAEHDFKRLIVPAALMRSAVVRRTVNARLGESGRAALKIATAAAASFVAGDRAREITHPLVDTLVLNHLSGSAAVLPLAQIRACLDGIAGNGADANLTESLAALAARSRGVIVYDDGAATAGFNPRGAGAPEVAGFNSALALATSFDPSLTAAHDLQDLKPRLKRLAEAMAAALEDACRNRETLAAAIDGGSANLSPAQQQAFAGFIELAENGPAALFEVGADPVRRAAALATVAAYQVLATVAGAVPRLGLMRDYLQATNLSEGFVDDDGGAVRDDSVEALERECLLLMPRMSPAALAGAGHHLDALEDRFQRFKWTYVAQYRSAHEHWRLELERLAPVAAAARRHLDALHRLNAIAALGAPAGAEIAEELAALDRDLRPCGRADALAPEVAPCCSHCGFRLGARSPRDRLNDLYDRARRALEVKLTALSRRAIARLIRQHDLNHRLEGFLKIIQAAHTDTLVSVLDDQLAGYLGRLLDENPAFDVNDASAPASRPAAQNRHAPTLRRENIDGRGARNGRVKAPPDGD
jgi:hypothetical protein